MTDANDHIDDWLRDAHAMEMQAETMLSAMASRIKNYPALDARIREHIEETREQARMLEACIDRRGGDTSTLKDLAGKAAASVQGLGGMFASDEVVKGAIAGYAFEHLEIASYTALVQAARTFGDSETERACSAILQQEKAMAKWLEENLPAVTEQFLGRSQVDDSRAKR